MVGHAISPAAFAEAAERSFSPVLIPEGFEVAETNPYQLCFRGRSIVVSVSYDQRGELGVSIGDDGSDERPLELGDVLRACGLPQTELWRANLQTSDAGAMTRLLGGAADLLQQYARPLLRGDEKLFAKAYAERLARWREYTERFSVSSLTIDAADAAWQERDYERVRSLLDPVRDRLDQTHLRRLEFAERHSPT